MQRSDAVDLLIVRHGNVEGIDPERYRGRTDVPLTPLGERQADDAARWIAARWKPSAIYASPLRRCIATAASVARACKGAVKILDYLNDIAYGTWQWRTPDEIRERSPELLERWYASPQLVRFPGGESLQDVAVRAGDALRFALDYHTGETIAFVTHDTVIRVMLCACLGLPLDAFWRFSPLPATTVRVRLSASKATVFMLGAGP